MLKKSLANEVRQKSDISERRRPLLYLQHGRRIPVQPVTKKKNEYNRFYHKLDA